ncbi:MAG: hypothetical protein IT168_10520 [Bryobacterales bacterium]|nr:hypothetical protein [Bryobacterales bacterium]
MKFISQRRRIYPFLGVLLILGLTLPLWLSRAQSSGQPPLRVGSIPAYGTDGLVKGEVAVASPADYWVGVYIFVPDVGWFARPGACFSQAVPGPDGKFQADVSQVPLDREATEISIYVFERRFTPPCVNKAAALPFAIERNALASRTFQREPRLRRLRFGGFDWYVKTSVVPTGPGPETPNYFLDSPNNVYIDALGRLHLRISRCGDTWCSSEIFTEKTLGFGTYRLTVETDVSKIDSNAVLGAFTWNHRAEANHREIDIEFSKWSRPAEVNNAQYVIQPYEQPGNMRRFAIPSGSGSTTHFINWNRDRVTFQSQTLAGQSIQSWTYSNNIAIPENALGTQFHLNFYLNNSIPPTTNAEQEVIISNFGFFPAAPEVTFTSQSVTSSFTAQALSVAVNSIDQSCRWSVVSQTPWAEVIDGAGSGNGLPKIRLEENTGPARTAVLQLDSRNCNLGNQSIVTVTQAEPDCSVTFTPGALYTDFRSKVETVAVALASPACGFTMSSVAPWLRIIRQPVISQQGTGTFDVAVTANDGQFRTDSIRANLSTLPVLQDAAGTVFSVHPSPAVGCRATGTKPAVKAFASSPLPLMQIRLGSPEGALVAELQSAGLITLGDRISDGNQLYLVGRSNPADANVTLAVARVSIRDDCGAASTGLAGSAVVDGVSFSKPVLVPNSIATLFGSNLSSATVSAAAGPVEELGGVGLRLCGVRPKLFFVSPKQINFLVPTECTAGRHRLTLNDQLMQEVAVVSSALSLAVVGGGESGVPLGFATLVNGSSRTDIPLFTCDDKGSCMAAKIEASGASDLYLALYGTGLGDAAKERIVARLGDEAGEVLFAGPHPQYPGMDQINIRFRVDQLKNGTSSLTLRTNGITSNEGVINLAL